MKMSWKGEKAGMNFRHYFLKISRKIQIHILAIIFYMMSILAYFLRVFLCQNISTITENILVYYGGRKEKKIVFSEAKFLKLHF